MERFTNNKEVGTSVRCTICGGLVSGELTHTGDNYCKGHKPVEITKEDIISDEAIKNVEKLIFLIKKLNAELEIFAEKYDIPINEVFEKIQKTIKL